MTTPEQQAREMLQRATSFDLTELANLIAENAALKAELAAIKGAGEPVAWAVKTNGRYNNMFLGNEQTAVERMCRLNFNFPGDKRAVVPLYTRPCVPLTDEPELLEALKRLLFAAQTTGGVAGRDEGLCAAIDAATAVIAKVVAHTKGAKG